MSSLLFKNGEVFIAEGDSEVNVLSLTRIVDSSLEVELISKLSAFFDFPFAPEINVLGTAPKWLGQIPSGKKITFYPGTFNPWHEGHLNCLELCPEANIVVVPDYSPWKSAGVSKSPWERVCELAKVIGKSQKTGLSLYPGFTVLSQPHATFDWLDKLQGYEISLIIGMDNFTSLSRWSKASELLNFLEKLYVVPRTFESLSDELLKEAFQFASVTAPSLEVIILPEHSAMDVSSTGLRKP